MHGPINVKSPNNTSKWQMGFKHDHVCLKFELRHICLICTMFERRYVCPQNYCGTGFRYNLLATSLFRTTLWIPGILFLWSKCSESGYVRIFLSNYFDAKFAWSIIFLLLCHLRARHPFRKMSASVCWTEITEILCCFMLPLYVATVLLQDNRLVVHAIGRGMGHISRKVCFDSSCVELIMLIIGDITLLTWYNLFLLFLSYVICLSLVILRICSCVSVLVIQI
jgi:hypothetical protein